MTLFSNLRRPRAKSVSEDASAMPKPQSSHLPDVPLWSKPVTHPAEKRVGRDGLAAARASQHVDNGVHDFTSKVSSKNQSKSCQCPLRGGSDTPEHSFRDAMHSHDTATSPPSSHSAISQGRLRALRASVRAMAQRQQKERAATGECRGCSPSSEYKWESQKKRMKAAGVVIPKDADAMAIAGLNDQAKYEARSGDGISNPGWRLAQPMKTEPDLPPLPSNIAAMFEAWQAAKDEESETKDCRYYGDKGVIICPPSSTFNPQVATAARPTPAFMQRAVPQPVIRPLVSHERGPPQLIDPKLLCVPSASQKPLRGPEELWKLPPLVTVREVLENDDELPHRGAVVHQLGDSVFQTFAHVQVNRHAGVQLLPVTSVISNAPSAKSTRSIGLSKSAFIKNVRRCARYVKDVVKHDSHWLPFDNETHDPRFTEDVAYEPDSDSANEGEVKSVFKLSAPPPPIVRDDLDSALEFKLNDAAKAARWKEERARVGEGRLSFNGLGKRFKAGLHVAIEKERKESLSSDESDKPSGPDSAAPVQKQEGTGKWLQRWNEHAYSIGWWHASAPKPAQPPPHHLPPALQALKLEPPDVEAPEQEVWVDVDGSWRNLEYQRNPKERLAWPEGYMRDPYDTEDYKRSNLVGLVGRVEKRRREREEERVGMVKVKVEEEEEDGVVNVAAFLDGWPQIKRSRTVSPGGMRGGCLSGEVEEMRGRQSLKRRMSLLAGDRLHHSMKRVRTAGRSFIDFGSPPSASENGSSPRKRRKFKPQRQHSIEPEPVPASSPPHLPTPPFPLGTPHLILPHNPRVPMPRPRTPTPPPRPPLLPARSALSRLGRSTRRVRRPCPVALNLDFVPLDLPRTGDFERFCELNAKTLRDMGRTFVERRLRAEEIWRGWHGLGLRRRRDSGFAADMEALESVESVANDDVPLSSESEKR